ILQDEEIPEIGAGVPAANGTAALEIERREIFLESLVLDRDLAAARVGVPHAAVASWQDAVEEVAAGANGREQVRGRSHAHEVPRLTLRQEAGRELGDLADRLLGLPHGDPADRVTGEVQIEKGRGRPPPQVLVGAPLQDPEEEARTIVGAA